MVRKVPDPNSLETIEKASVDELRALQFKRMKWSISHAWENSKPYRARCDAVGIAPSDLESLEDLGKFPFTVKGDLRQSYPFGMFAVPQKDVVRNLLDYLQALVSVIGGRCSGRIRQAVRRAGPGGPAERVALPDSK